MDIKKEVEAKVAQLQDINKQLHAIEKEIGTLQEKGRAIHSQGLQIKGAVDMLLQLLAKEEAALKTSETAKLILPEGVKPVIPEEVLPTAEGDIPAKPVETEVK